MDSKSTKNALLQSTTIKTKAPYKRGFLRMKAGLNEKYRFLNQQAIDINKTDLFYPIKIHSGVIHPDYPERTYGINVKCVGKGCPLCREYFQLSSLERKSGIIKGEAWKLKATTFTLFWAINKKLQYNTNETRFVLVHVNNEPFMAYNSKTQTSEQVGFTAHENLIAKLVKATDSGLTPFNYQGGNDVHCEVYQQQSKLRLSVNVDEKKNDIHQNELMEFKKLPTLDRVYRDYSREEIECMVQKKSLKEAHRIYQLLEGEKIKAKQQKEKSKTFDENIESETINLKNDNEKGIDKP